MPLHTKIWNIINKIFFVYPQHVKKKKQTDTPFSICKMHHFTMRNAQKNPQQVEQKSFIFYGLFMIFPVILLFKNSVYGCVLSVLFLLLFLLCNLLRNIPTCFYSKFCQKQWMCKRKNIKKKSMQKHSLNYFFFLANVKCTTLFYSHHKTGSCHNLPLLSLFTLIGTDKQRHTGENVPNNTVSTCVMQSGLFKFSSKFAHSFLLFDISKTNKFLSFMIFANFLMSYGALFRISRRR